MTEGVGIQLSIITKGRVAAPDPDAAKRKADRENGRQQAQEFAHEALLATVATLRSSKDPSVVLKAAKLIMDRAWGIPKSADEEEANAKNQSIIEILAAFSTQGPALGHEQAPAIAHDTAQPAVLSYTPSEELEALFLPDEPVEDA